MYEKIYKEKDEYFKLFISKRILLSYQVERINDDFYFHLISSKNQELIELATIHIFLNNRQKKMGEVIYREYRQNKSLFNEGMLYSLVNTKNLNHLNNYDISLNDISNEKYNSFYKKIEHEFIQDDENIFFQKGKSYKVHDLAKLMLDNDPSSLNTELENEIQFFIENDKNFSNYLLIKSTCERNLLFRAFLTRRICLNSKYFDNNKYFMYFVLNNFRCRDIGVRSYTSELLFRKGLLKEYSDQLLLSISIDPDADFKIVLYGHLLRNAIQ